MNFKLGEEEEKCKSGKQNTTTLGIEWNEMKWNGMELISQNICDSKISNLGKLYSYTFQSTNQQTNKRQHEQIN